MTSPVPPRSSFMSVCGRIVGSCAIAGAGAALIGPKINGIWLSQVGNALQESRPMRYAVAALGVLVAAPVVTAAASSLIAGLRRTPGPGASLKTPEQQLAEIGNFISTEEAGPARTNPTFPHVELCTRIEVLFNAYKLARQTEAQGTAFWKNQYEIAKAGGSSPAESEMTPEAIVAIVKGPNPNVVIQALPAGKQQTINKFIATMSLLQPPGAGPGGGS